MAGWLGGRLLMAAVKTSHPRFGNQSGWRNSRRQRFSFGENDLLNPFWCLDSWFLGRDQPGWFIFSWICFRGSRVLSVSDNQSVRTPLFSWEKVVLLLAPSGAISCEHVPRRTVSKGKLYKSFSHRSWNLSMSEGLCLKRSPVGYLDENSWLLGVISWCFTVLRPFNEGRGRSAPALQPPTFTEGWAAKCGKIHHFFHSFPRTSIMIFPWNATHCQLAHTIKVGLSKKSKRWVFGYNQLLFKV